MLFNIGMSTSREEDSEFEPVKHLKTDFVTRGSWVNIYLWHLVKVILVNAFWLVFEEV